MKILYLILLTSMLHTDMLFNPIEPCPDSPNCVCTLKNSKGYMEPIPYKLTMQQSKIVVKTLMVARANSKIIAEFDNHIHYEVTTKLGKFKDDVEFYWDEKGKVIHFRSASQKGWYDFGANKRRMKKLTKQIIELSKNSK